MSESNGDNASGADAADDGSDEEATREVTITVPAKEPQERTAWDQSEERRHTSIRDGPSVGFTGDTVRVYDPEREEYVELTNVEVAELLADIYGVSETADSDTTE